MRKQKIPERNARIRTVMLLAAAVASGGAIAGAELPDSAVNLKNVNVTARKSTDKNKSTAPTHQLDAEAILQKGVTDISDAMHRLPGINLRDYGGSGGLKTVSVRGLGSQHTGVIYDGAALSEVRGGSIDLSRYSLENVGSLTLNVGDNDDIFSPARALASASTLVISTQKLPDMLSTDPEVRASLKVGAFGMISPGFRVGKSNGKDLCFSAAGNFIHAKNNYPFTLYNVRETSREKRENSQLNSGHVELNGVWKPRAWNSLAAKIYFYDSSRQLPGPVIYYAAPSNERLGERNMFGQLKFNTRIGSRFSLRTMGKYNWSSTRYRDEKSIYTGGLLDQKYIQREEYVSAALLYNVIKGLNIAYSVDYFHNSLSSDLADDSHPYRHSVLQALSVKYKIWRLTATARGLLSCYSDKSDQSDERRNTTRLSPSAGISLQPLENIDWHIRASYKNIFRMPTFNELYFDHYGSINLDPEITDQYNFGMTYGYRGDGVLGSLSVTADGYLNHVRNKIVAVPYNMFVMTMTNLGKVRVLGFDATVSADFRIDRRNDIMVTGNYTYQRAATRTSPGQSDWMKQLPYTPLNSGAWSVSWLNPWVNTVIHGFGCGARYTTTSNIESTRMPGYMEVGFRLYHDFRFGRNTLQLCADLINAFDKQYEVVARYPMPGISWAFSVTYTLGGNNL